MQQTFRSSTYLPTFEKTGIPPLPTVHPDHYYNAGPVETAGEVDGHVRPTTPMIAKRPDHPIYDQGHFVSEARSIGGRDLVEAPIVTKKVIRHVEVPVWQEVKVPVKHETLVEGTEKVMVKTKKIVEVPTTKTVLEEYKDIEERVVPGEKQHWEHYWPSTGMDPRIKEVWVRKADPGAEKRRVEVTKTRQVQVPTTALQEVEQLVEVDVPTTRRVAMDAFRVDKIQGSKVVEVEEEHDFELRPVLHRAARVTDIRDRSDLAATSRNFNGTSRIHGAEVFATTDSAIAHLPTDFHAPAPPPGVGQTRALSASWNSGLNLALTARPPSRVPTGSLSSRSARFAAQASRSAGANSAYGLQANLNTGGGSGSWSQRESRYSYNGGKTSGFSSSSSFSSTARTVANQGTGFGSTANAYKRIGVTLRDSDLNGCVVTEVQPGSPAHLAGLRHGDVITHLNNRPSRNRDEFRGEIYSKLDGAAQMRVNRNGSNLAVTVAR